MRIGSVFRSAILLLALAASGTALTGCTGSDGHTDDEGHKTGSAVILASVEQGLSAADVARVSVTISGADFAPMSHDLAKHGSQWAGTFGEIPAGTGRSFHAEAYDAGGAILFTGDASPVSIVADQTAAVSLLLQQANPPVPFTNAAPRIDAFYADATRVAPGGSIVLRVTAHDPNLGDTLHYAWNATGGSFNDDTATMVTWTAPATTGPQVITIRVTDDKNAAASTSLTVQVADNAARGSATVSAFFNVWPDVLSVTATPTRIDVSESTSLAVSASDADGDPLSYAWTADCSGNFSDTHASAPDFTLSSLPASGSCTLSVVVTDGRGGSNSGSILIATGPDVAPEFAPVVDSSFVSSESARAGEDVTLSLSAHAVSASGVTFAWSASSGALSNEVSTATGSDATWTAPAAGFGSATITATVTDTDGNSVTRSFTVVEIPNGTIVATGHTGIGRIVADALGIAWIDGDGSIHSASGDGSNAHTIASGETGAATLAMDATHVYWAKYDASGGVSRAPRDGSSASEALTSGANFFGIAVSGSTVYAGQTGNIVGMPLTGSPSPSIVAGGIGAWALDLAADANRIYWTNWGGDSVLSAPLGGGSATTLASTGSHTTGMAVDGTHVYWANWDTGTIQRVLGDGSASPETLASGRSHPNAVAVDGTYVYWTEADADGLVMYAPRTGGTALVLAEHEMTPIGIAVDSSYVYWTNSDEGTVRRSPKP